MSEDLARFPIAGERDTLVELLAPARRDRLRAVRELAPSPAAAFALRRVLFADRDAEVRAAAARRLAELAAAASGAAAASAEEGPLASSDGALEAWLLDALGDGSPLVRDAILRALARVGTAASVPALRELVERDGMWWVRRGAIYALAAVAGAAELPALMRALADPFWRVRHAAVKVLAVLGARDPDVRAEVTAAAPPALGRPTSPAEPPGEQLGFASALTFLRAAWGPVAIEAPARAASASRLPPELLDPDPAVVAARLEAGAFEPLALVELLCDPHVPLRALAAHRIAAAGDLAALEAALDWLEEPRIPHVADTVHELLDGLGDPAAVLAARTLARRDRPGAARWAIEWVVATSSGSLYRRRPRARPPRRHLAPPGRAPARERRRARRLGRARPRRRDRRRAPRAPRRRRARRAPRARRLGAPAHARAAGSTRAPAAATGRRSRPRSPIRTTARARSPRAGGSGTSATPRSATTPSTAIASIATLAAISILRSARPR